MWTLAEKCCVDNVNRLILVLGTVTVAKEEPTEKFLCECLSERHLGTGRIFPVTKNFMIYLRTANLIEHEKAVVNRHRTVFIPLSLTPPAEKVNFCIDQILGGEGTIWYVFILKSKINWVVTQMKKYFKLLSSPNSRSQLSIWSLHSV